VDSQTIELAGISKAFGAHLVLRGVDLTLRPGQVTALMGANGAGKSTLVKILAGVHAPSAGTISLFGKPFSPATPSAAIKAGVVTVHQNINDGVIPDLDVASNLMLDHLAAPGSGFFLNARAMRAQARALAATMGLEVDVRRMVSDLDVADRQLVAIARAMAHKPRLLILDEPTSSLSAVEARRLFGLIDRLRKAGVAILYISHRMSDIHRIADRIVSMRDGRIAGIFEDTPLDYKAAVTAMLGQSMADVDIAIPDTGGAVLELENIRLRADSEPFSATFHANEVVAIIGLVGCGKTDLANILFGLEKPCAGAMSLRGRPYAPATPRAAIEAGVFLCSKDRANNGVVPDFDITRNITLPFLPRHSAFAFLKPGSERTTTRRMISELGIICQSDRDEIGALSGGNQQKVMVARWLAESASLLVLDEPFQGVDIKARRDIGRKIRETAAGRATVVMLAETDEALEIADRILVMSDYGVMGDHRNDGLDLGLIQAQVAGQTQSAARAVSLPPQTLAKQAH